MLNKNYISVLKRFIPRLLTHFDSHLIQAAKLFNFDELSVVFQTISHFSPLPARKVKLF